LLSTNPAQLLRMFAIAGEKRVERPGRVVAGLIGVKKKDPAAAAAENQRGAQSGRAGANDDNIEFHAAAGSKIDAAST
jgi:hypothetical protein